MADAPTYFSTISTDAPNVFINEQMIKLAEKNLVLGKFADRYSMPQRSGKTLRVVRYSRLALPRTTLTEGTPPDAVALAVTNVDVTVEQWGIVTLLTDVGLITTKHPALQIAIDRTALAMSEVLEREMGSMLTAASTNVVYATGTTRQGLAATNKLTSTVAVSASSVLRSLGAAPFEGNLYGGVIAPQVEADVLAADATFQAASNYANVRRLEYGEIGIWMGTRWLRGNFLPIFKGAAAADTGAETAFKPQINATDGGGTITSSTNFKFQFVYKDKLTLLPRRITQVSANVASAATGNNESFTLDVLSGDGTNYVYDVYMTTTAGAGGGSLYLVASNQAPNGAGSTVVTAAPAGTEATSPFSDSTPSSNNTPASGIEVFMGFVFGKGGWGRVELNGMSMESFVTPPGSSWANPLAQGRKVGSKIMWKSFLLDGNYIARIETGSAFSANLPA